MVNSTEGAAYGAALLAGVGAGIWAGVDSVCHAAVRLVGSTARQPETVSAYASGHALYRQLYPALKPVSHGLSS
jgi:xylulokinase